MILAAATVGVAALPNDRTTLLAVAVPGGPTQVFDATEIPNTIAQALGQVRLVGQGLKPAVAFLQRCGVRPTQVFDTQIAWQLYDGHRHEGSSSFFSLDSARRTAGIVPVSAGDSAHDRLRAEAEHVLVFERVLRARLQEDGLEEVAELEMSLLPIVAEMKTTGVAIDAAAWKKVTSAWSVEATALERALITTLGVNNIHDNEQVLAALQRLGLPVDKTSGAALAKYSDRPVVAQLMRYRTLDGFVRSSGKAVLEALERSTDRRVRTTIHQLGARTGRMSCSEPNLMGLPRAKEVRACIVAPPGMKLIVADYSNIEMRVIADYTGDEKLREVFRHPDGDAHRHTAAVLLHKPEAEVLEEERKKIKPVNFGLSFGMGLANLISYARKNFKVVLTQGEAESFRAGFFQHYKGIQAWHERSRRRCPCSSARAAAASRTTCATTRATTRASASLQGTAADGMKAAIVLLHPQLARLGARIVLVVHHELVVEVPKEHSEEVRRLVRDGIIAGMGGT